MPHIFPRTVSSEEKCGTTISQFKFTPKNVMTHSKNNLFESEALYEHKCRPTYIVKYTLKYSPQTLCAVGLKETF